MRNRKTFDDVVNIIKESNLVLIFPHVIPDGDAIGCSAALLRSLRKLGKQVNVFIEEDIPEYLNFLSGDFSDDFSDYSKADICIALDCSDAGRIGKRIDMFNKGKTTINIDHHPTNTFYADYNYVDDQASATGEIIFDLLKALDIEFDKNMAEAIYSAISTDTGSFKYTNTSSKSHMVAAELLDLGVDLSHISVELYQNTRLEKIRLQTEVLETLEIFCDGKAAFAYATEKMIERTGASMDETEGFIEILRNIQGVEVAVFFKEVHDNEIKVGLRAKKYANVSKIAMEFGGGGHIKAAGCTINNNLEDAKRLLVQAIEEHLNDMQE